MRTSDGSEVGSFDVTSSPRLSVSGNTLMIDPSKDLVDDIGYHVLIDSNAITDLSGDPFRGIADTTYTLTVATGWRKDLAYPGYGIELWAGGVLLASDYNTDAGNSGPAADTWKDVTATFTSGSNVTAGQSLEICLRG